MYLAHCNIWITHNSVCFIFIVSGCEKIFSLDFIKRETSNQVVFVLSRCSICATGAAILS